MVDGKAFGESLSSAHDNMAPHGKLEQGRVNLLIDRELKAWLAKSIFSITVMLNKLMMCFQQPSAFRLICRLFYIEWCFLDDVVQASSLRDGVPGNIEALQRMFMMSTEVVIIDFRSSTFSNSLKCFQHDLSGKSSFIYKSNEILWVGNIL
ncbi:hypothetical protein BO71DRAFT_481960 [Aspergillus ellipticus CBS 707.79]|uniref:Uncharacterized protein n=1 Tax=Aspergillus ellipticus CBS 707.79 TaxID=1448320 RepID=A0A319DHL6_9EURO|nr:hypothetical protein BO71DRAFT_481960 [Aspergillus ellipticus CBS 707.79]